VSYDKVNWDEATPITASRLDQMDNGIKEVASIVEGRIWTGSYSGTETDEQVITLPSEPIFMLVIGVGIQGFFWGENESYIGFYFDDDKTFYSKSGINTSGEFVAKSSDGFNSDQVYFYFGVS